MVDNCKGQPRKQQLLSEPIGCKLGGSAVSLRGAPREYTGYEYAEHSGMRPSTAECVSSRVLIRVWP